MSVNINTDKPFVLRRLLIFIVIVIAVVRFSFARAHKAIAGLFWRRKTTVSDGELLGSLTAKTSFDEKDIAVLVVARKESANTQDEEIQLYSDLYFKLQNLEQYPEILPRSRDLLISLFSETLAEAHKKPKTGILSVGYCARESLAKFLRSEGDKTTQQWEQYLTRRKAGGAMELFKDKEEAKWWLKQVAPVKYVDGAWLGHINKITTPFYLRRASKDAWQVLSEEYGDGDLDKHHVQLYRELMQEIGSGLPEGYTADFIHPRHNLNEPRVWKAAISQLLISLFPHEFLPEILGFNMHYELLTLNTMKAAKELEELKLNAYYFTLHISIDNADSGHAAVAMEAVLGYIELIQRTHGDRAAQEAWKRIQAGYILSEGLPSYPKQSKSAIGAFPRNECEAETIKIFKAKAQVAQKIHCGSRTKIGRQTLANWLASESFASQQRQMDFLDDLSNTKPWVCKGDSCKSKFIQELSWKGKMFGSFTQSEVEVVRRWIDSLGKPDPLLYWSFVGRTEITSTQVLQNQDIRVDYPVFPPISANDFSTQSPPSLTLPLPMLSSIMIADSTPNMSKLIPLWFAHPCLLECFICIPSRTTNKTACSIVRFLRAQYGFGDEGPGVAGMDEVRRTESVGLVELGLEILKRSGLPELGSLKEVLQTWRSAFALMMLRLSMRPRENAGLLFGLASAFVSLHDAMTLSTLLSAASRNILAQMVRREQDSLNICLEELKEDKVQYQEFCRGYNLGIAEIGSCFNREDV